MFSNLGIKKLYYYIICLIALFIFLWGAIDLASSSIGLVGAREASVSSPAPQEELSPGGDQLFDSYYQKKMLADRFWDSFARVLVSGIVFAYARYNTVKIEKAA